MPANSSVITLPLCAHAACCHAGVQAKRRMAYARMLLSSSFMLYSAAVARRHRERLESHACRFSARSMLRSFHANFAFFACLFCCVLCMSPIKLDHLRLSSRGSCAFACHAAAVPACLQSPPHCPATAMPCAVRRDGIIQRIIFSCLVLPCFDLN